MAMVERWVHRGIIKDPYHEFLVLEDPGMTKSKLTESVDSDDNDNYWDRHYTLTDAASIPPFLRRAAPLILITGKYLNAIRECGRDVSYPEATPIKYTQNDRDILEAVELTHNYANDQLLDLLFKEYNLLKHLRLSVHFLLHVDDYYGMLTSVNVIFGCKHNFRSVKHYFLVEQGNWIETFMDISNEELSKKVNSILILSHIYILKLLIILNFFFF